MKLIIYQANILFLSLAISGCAISLTTAGRSVKVSELEAVSSCTYLGEVHGSSGWGNIAASTGMHNAKVEAREEAADMGATNIVWKKVAGGYSPYAIGKAYRCSK